MHKKLQRKRSSYLVLMHSIFNSNDLTLFGSVNQQIAILRSRINRHIKLVRRYVRGCEAREQKSVHLYQITKKKLNVNFCLTPLIKETILLRQAREHKCGNIKICTVFVSFKMYDKSRAIFCAVRVHSKIPFIMSQTGMYSSFKAQYFTKEFLFCRLSFTLINLFARTWNFMFIKKYLYSPSSHKGPSQISLSFKLAAI